MSDIRTLSDKEQAILKLPVFFDGYDNYYHPIKEVVVNARDILKSATSGKIKVTLHEDNKTVTVEDNGIGLPMIGETDGIPNWRLLFLTLFSGTKMGSGNDSNGGTNGCGNTMICYTSDYMEITVMKDGKEYNIAFKDGGDVDKEFKCMGDTDKQGTIISFRLSPMIYTNTVFDAKVVEDIVRNIAITSPNIVITFEHNGVVKSFNYPSLQSFVAEEFKNKLIEDIIIDEKSYQSEFFNLDKKKEDIETTTISLVITSMEEDNGHFSILNGIYLPKQGSIHDGVINGITNSLNTFIKNNNMYKKEKSITKNDVIETISYVCSVTSTNVSYVSQSKFSTAKKLYEELTKQHIQDFMESYFLEQRDNALILANRVLINKRAREKAENIRKISKQKATNELRFTDNIKNYKPCILKDKNVAELYINEGSSAQGGVLKARDEDFQAAFHVGGKMKSLLKANEKSLFSNDVVNNLYKVLGCGIELWKSKYNKEKLPQFNIDALNWNKLIIATDQDIDAYQIRCLILTTIYRMSPLLIEEGKVYIAEAPLYEITTNSGEEFFAYTDIEKEEILSELNKKGVKYKTPERNKGLGEMDKYSMAKAIMNPKTRRLTQVKVSDIENMKKSFELWMGEEVTDRRSVITQNFDYVEKFEDLREKDVVDILHENYLPYAISMITDRAIISLDGFKPAHRKLLWTLHEKGLYGKRVKSANVVGDNMSYNVHGDGSIYQTLVRMAQDDTLLYPYVNGKGNFGQHTSKTIDPAHMRYTEAGATEINKEFFKDINKNVVPMVDNFDGQKKEPSILPTTFPNVLVNYNSGIAVGMASTTPSFPLREVCETTIEYIKNKNIDLLDTLKAPDFATGGSLIYDEKELRKIYETGQGSIVLRGKYKVKDDKIIITEIPYTTCTEEIVDRIKELCKTNDSKYKSIIDTLDSTGLNGMSITIKIKKNTNVEKLMASLYKNTKLQTSQPFNMNILCLDNIPRVLGIKEILNQWIEFRRSCIIKSFEYDIKNKTEKLYILKGLEKILLDIDKAIDIIKNCDEDKIITALCEYFNISEVQAENVANMKLRNINKEYIIKQTKQIQQLENDVNDLKYKSNTVLEIDKIMISDLERVSKQFGKDRMTEIVYPHEIEEIASDELIEDYSTTLVFTNEGYFKKTLKYSQNQRTKDGDFVKTISQTTNRGEVLFISNKGYCHKVKINNIDTCQPSSLGAYLPSILQLENGEIIIDMLATTDFQGYALYSFENGKIAKIPLSSFETKTNRSKLANSLNLESEIVSIIQVLDDIDLYIESSQSKAVIINTSLINEKASKNSQGITVMKSNKNDFRITKVELYENQVDINYKVDKLGLAGNNI